jgi:hypothetical protein
MITWADAHRRAAALAAEVHADLDLDLNRPVDVFGAIQRAGLVLAFAPLGRVSGLYLPVTPTRQQAGVLLHDGHPRTRQRYTAGHELGHHVFGHGAEVDLDLEQALQRGDTERWSDHEKEAEAFGAWFLMPRRLLRAGLRELGLDRPRSPLDVYTLALWLGTSYTATARQLGTTRLLPYPVSDQWAHVSPRTIKLALAGELAPDDLRNDVWWLDASSHQHPVDARPGDRLVIDLPENVSTGYSWRFTQLSPGFALLADSFDDPWEPRVPDTWRPTVSSDAAGPDAVDVATGAGSELAGAASHRAFVVEIRPDTPMNIYHLALVKDRPWQPGEDVIDEFELLVAVVPRLRGVQLPEHELRLPA